MSHTQRNIVTLLLGAIISMSGMALAAMGPAPVSSNLNIGNCDAVYKVDGLRQAAPRFKEIKSVEDNNGETVWCVRYQ